MSQQRLFGEFEPVTYEQWRAQIKGDDFDRKLVTRTLDGLRVAPVYTAADVPPEGFAPISGVAGGSWEVRQGASVDAAADPIATLARAGMLADSLDVAAAKLVDRAKQDQRDASKSRGVLVDASVYHDAGAGPALEAGLTLATFVTYLRWLTDGGVSVDDAARSIEVSVGVSTDFFGEIAKLRALRLCLAKVIAHCGGNSDAATTSIHAVTSQRTATQRDPWVNMLRTTTETFAAAAGGANAITAAGYDALLGPESELARRMAHNAQVILDEESHVRAVTDPAAGSYFVENLTQDIARAAWTTFVEIEAAGGIVKALQAGVVQKAVKAQADKSLAEVRTRKRAITGVSEFALISEPPLPTAPAAKPSRTAVAAAITVEPLLPARLSAPYEALRDRSDAYLAKHGKRPRLFLCNVGSVTQWKARAGFTQNLAWAGGVDALGADQGHQSADDAVKAFVSSGAKLAAICSNDDTYPEIIPPLAKALRAQGAALVVVAGKPAEHETTYREAGAGLFIHVGCDVVAALDTMLSALTTADGAKS